MKTVKIRISKNGTIQAEGENFHGKGCVEKTERLLRGLGTQTKQELKDSYYEEAAVEIFETNG